MSDECRNYVVLGDLRAIDPQESRPLPVYAMTVLRIATYIYVLLTFLRG